MHRMDPSGAEEPDKDFMVVAIDLMSSVVEGLGGVNIGGLLDSSPTSTTDMMPLLLQCMRDVQPEVKIAVLEDNWSGHSWSAARL